MSTMSDKEGHRGSWVWGRSPDLVKTHWSPNSYLEEAMPEKDPSAIGEVDKIQSDRNMVR